MTDAVLFMQSNEGKEVPTLTHRRAPTLLGIDRNVIAASTAVLLVGLGEQLWKKFLPKYLESLGAGAVAVGLFGTSEDFLDAVYQYPGGWLADHWGRRRTLLALLIASLFGYALYFLSPSWPFVFLGLVFAMSWQSMTSPAIFATIGDVLPSARRTMGFTLQSMLKRVPMVISPLLGGLLIAALGLQRGVRAGLLITVAFGGLTIPVLRTIDIPHLRDTMRLAGVWNSFHFTLKRLLISDIAIRTCEGISDIFVILYVTNITRVSVPRYGILVSIELASAILVYLPSAKLAGRLGRKPFVIATFLCFAVFPVAVVFARDFRQLMFAFVIGGLREMGEPARKAMIVDLARQDLRARTVGLYYLIRSLSITPASVLGGLAWRVRPELPFVVAGTIGVVGTILFAATVEEPEVVF